MKNKSWSRLIGWLLTVAMILTILPAASFAADDDETTIIPENTITSPQLISALESVDVTNSAGVSYTDEKGGKVTPEQMDPNKKYHMTLSLKDLNAIRGMSAATKMVFVPNNVRIISSSAEQLSNDAVSAALDGEKLILSWKDKKQDTVGAEFTVIPHIAPEKNLSGRYILGTEHKAILGTAAFVENNRDKLSASTFTERDGKINPVTNEDPVWVLTHVSGNYYTVRSENTGKYLYISPTNSGSYREKSLYLVNGNEETAQKILVENVGNGYYSFTYNKYAINNSSNTPAKGFGSYTYGGGANEKFRLYDVSSLAHDATKDLSGSWTIYNMNQKTILTVRDSAPASVRYKIKDSNTMFPNSDVVNWTFEHVNRDWYTIQAGGMYLNITKTGVSVSSTAQPLLVQSDDGYQTVVITNGEFTEINIANTLNAQNASSFNVVNRTKTFGANVKFNLANNVYEDKADIEGEWAITTPSSGAVLLAKASGSNKLASATFDVLEDGTIFADTDAGISWTFTKEDGGWYSIRAKDGKYLSIKDSVLSLSDEKTLVYIQKDNNLYRIAGGSLFALNNSGNNAKNGYGSVNSGDLNVSNEWNELRKPSTVTVKMVFDMNSGEGNAPAAMYGQTGDRVTLPGMEAIRDGQNFIGWAEVNNIYSNVSGTKHTYRTVYTPGSTYTMKAGLNKLYAVYNTQDRTVQFGIRGDGVIQDEPNSYDVKGYKGHFKVDGILKEGRWVIDIDSTKPVKDYYMANNVTDCLNWVPSAEDIAAALMKDGGISFDPESQYIHYYVLKYTGSEWHVDGVIRNKENVGINYETNVPAGVDKTKVSNMPGGYQVTPGTDILIGADQNSNEIKRPGLQGYFFVGWNTKADGTGDYYDEKETIHLTENLHLYAQWVSEDSTELVIRIHSDWPKGKIGYVGAKIKLISTLTGFENKIYTLQWQYSDDEGMNWTDVPDAHDETYTYTLNEITTHYIWRVVAQDIR